MAAAALSALPGGGIGYPVGMDTDRPSHLRKVLRMDILMIESCCDAASMAARNGIYDDEFGTPYLDLVTGQVENISDSDGDEDDEPDWDRYLSFPTDIGRLEWPDVIEFAEGLENARHREELLRLANGCGAFRRVRDYIFGANDLALKHAWNWFETCKGRENIVDWLHDAGIEPDWGCDIFSPPELPNRRKEMLEIARDFVLAARGLPGVAQIALSGSLATDETNPVDVTFVVAVEDDMDLTPLAKLRRQLEGKTMALGDGRWSDVFLTDLAGTYLGRICPWKDCVPGIRRACRADHCGRRHFLHDDLRNFKPMEKVQPWPPIRIFPAPTDGEPAPPLPQDAATMLLAPL